MPLNFSVSCTDPAGLLFENGENGRASVNGCGSDLEQCWTCTLHLSSLLLGRIQQLRTGLLCDEVKGEMFCVWPFVLSCRGHSWRGEIRGTEWSVWSYLSCREGGIAKHNVFCSSNLNIICQTSFWSAVHHRTTSHSHCYNHSCGCGIVYQQEVVVCEEWMVHISTLCVS